MEIILVVIAAWLRLSNLGYSDYQGDEIKALFLPPQGQSALGFLMDQRKGPIQFLITAFLKIFDPDYSNQFLIRLPFALAGILAVYFFYKLIKLHFGNKVAFYSTFFVATNGFLIAFSRIVQYQSFVILFMILALYVFSLASVHKKWEIKGIYLGFLFWALSILSHYDGIFIGPFVLYILYTWYTKSGISVKRRIRHFIGGGLVFVSSLAVFYVPFILTISAATMDYWQGRLTGTGGKISSSQYLFRVYNPIYIIHIYAALGILGFVKAVIPPQLRTKLKEIALFAWFILAFFFMEILVSIPGTHIYTYLIPLTVFMGIGVTLVQDVVRKIFPANLSLYLSTAGIAAVFLFIFLQVNQIFVDNYREYPWENEKFLVWEFHKPSAVFHLSMFGFPYQRDWEGVNSIVRSFDDGSEEIFYSTNERSPISRYYVPFRKSGDNAQFYVYVHRPQSYTDSINNERIRALVDREEPYKIYFDESGRVRTKLYYFPRKHFPVGSTERSVGEENGE
jgi:4-amino-4-deoxy-L-arabinose transferase-like glycosyltransferase